MKLTSLLLYLALLLVLTTCDPIKHKVLILGNSITEHGPVESIGWSGSWGMAASSKDKDFVHVLIKQLQTYMPMKELDAQLINVAGWEQNYQFDFSNEKLVKFGPDILIIRLGENGQEAYARDNDYKGQLIQLINRFKVEGTRVLITGNFWPAPYKDEIQRQVAEENGYAFVDMSDIAADGSNRATGQFENPGVAMHPSDRGMFNIADKIFKRIVAENWY